MRGKKNAIHKFRRELQMSRYFQPVLTKISYTVTYISVVVVVFSLCCSSLQRLNFRVKKKGFEKYS